ncbi:MAG: hypothetical protein P857_591 [Candidatus Xenolissoclinum pacificiensis L6]|uniref:S-adenosyl-L-methionine-dependent methyltransferase family protein n=1 Tax=Candidatus Xenolissoclinum pacificiensis L6 TaxID=1401685 RepID=W2UZ07_9RICK|nr:MAG: hypothetical protein P857_591 [Candidatus Xenolissoclinum pacificiensis L6]
MAEVPFHLDKLFSIIRDKSYVTLAEYMEYALYDREYGYYMKQNPLDKDFITSVSITQLFCETLALWIVDEWTNFQAPVHIHLVELGAGNGTMIYDILNFLFRYHKNCFEAISVTIIEVSPTLILVQKKKLDDFIDKVDWRQSLLYFKPCAPVLFIGNEFFDAFPVDQYLFTSRLWKQKVISLSEEGSLCVLWKKTHNIELPLRNIGDVIEISTGRMTFLYDIRLIIAKYGGSGLFIDYGYFDKPYKDTVQCMFQNSYCDLLDNVTCSDITCYVDFSEFSPYKRYITQGEFLVQYGIYQRLESVGQNLSFSQKCKLVYAVERLVNRNYMGDIFKVIII